MAGGSRSMTRHVAGTAAITRWASWNVRIVRSPNTRPFVIHALRASNVIAGRAAMFAHTVAHPRTQDDESIDGATRMPAWSLRPRRRRSAGALRDARGRRR